MTDIIKKTGFRNGIFLGIFLILLSSYIYFGNLSLLTNVWAGALTLVLTIVFGILSILQLKGKLGGFITFREAFSVYFITVLTGSFISCLYTIILYSFILSPETKETIRMAMIDFNITLMKQNQAPQESIDEALEMYKTFNPFTPTEAIAASLKYLLRDCLFGFLVALIFRNKRTL